MTGGQGRGFRVTGRDREFVAWLGLHRFATAGQLARRFDVDRKVVYRRLAGLERLGLVEHRRVFHARPGVFLATRAGLAFAGVVLAPATVDVATYEHTLGVVDLACGFERRGFEVVGERAMRAAEAAGAGRLRYAVRLHDLPSPRALHFPDLAVHDDGGVAALELELSPKGRRRWARIVQGYRAARHLSSVTYYVASAEIDRRLRSVVAEKRAEGIITVRRWAPGDGDG